MYNEEVQPVIAENWSLRTIVEQLEFCGYKDEIGHSLHMNSAFIALKKMTEAAEAIYAKDMTIEEIEAFKKEWAILR